MSDPRDLREEFRPTAAEYRRVSALLRIPMFFAVAFWILLYFFPKYRTEGIAGLVVCIAAPIIGSLVWLPKLDCPGCHARLDKGPGFLSQSSLGEYCPECGAAAVGKGWLYPKCTACGKRLTQGRGGRQYKIRYCTWCDARVDDEGL
jgi:hypothetical protein